MTKSSSIYIGEAKMALAGKWQSAIVACSVAVLVSMMPAFFGYILNQIFGSVNPSDYQTIEAYEQALASSSDRSGLEIVSMIFNPIWMLLMSIPVMLSCYVGIRELHIENKSPFDVMYLFFRANYVGLLKLMWNAALKILKVCGIPLALYVVFRLLHIWDDDYYAASRYESLANLCEFVFIVLFIYKTLEYTFVSYLKYDFPNNTNEEILSQSENLMKGNRMLVFKMGVRAALPVIPILFCLCILFIFLAVGTLFGSLFALLMNGNIDTYSIFDKIGPVWYYVWKAIQLLIVAFVFSRFLMECSVLYSEVTDYKPKSEEEEKEKQEESHEQIEEKKEDDKDNDKGPDDINLEPEIPYEQRYMPK